MELPSLSLLERDKTKPSNKIISMQDDKVKAELHSWFLTRIEHSDCFRQTGILSCCNLFNYSSVLLPAMSRSNIWHRNSKWCAFVHLYTCSECIIEVAQSIAHLHRPTFWAVSGFVQCIFSPLEKSHFWRQVLITFSYHGWSLKHLRHFPQ